MNSINRNRILFCEGNIDGTIGGSYFSLLYLVQGLDKTQYDPMVVFLKDNNLIPVFRASGIETIVIEKRKPIAFRVPEIQRFPGHALLNRLLRLLQKPVNFWRFLPLAALEHAKFLRKHRIDLVHLNNSIVRNHDWMLGAQLSGTICITHERGINKTYPPIAKYYAKRLGAVVCISNAVRDNLVSKGVPSKRLITIYNGIDPKILTDRVRTQDIRGDYNIGPDELVIGVIGNIKRWKGQETAIRALAHVSHRHPSVKCLLVGDVSNADSLYMQHLLKETSRLNIEKNVVFVGFVENVADYLSTMDIVLHTSIEPEPFGRVLIEAMSLRKPLIGANGGAVPEIIQDNETGLLFTPGNDAELADHIMKILDEPSLSKKMARRSFERVNDLFHIDRHVQKVQDLYSRLLSE